MISVGQAKPILMGVVGGAVVLAIVGFSWGGWVTGGTAEEMANDRADSAVVAALAPICVAQFQQQSDSDSRLSELIDIRSFQRTAFIEEGGMGDDAWQRCRQQGRGTGLRGDDHRTRRVLIPGG